MTIADWYRVAGTVGWITFIAATSLIFYGERKWGRCLICGHRKAVITADDFKKYLERDN